MDKKLFRAEVVGFIAVSVLGMFAHFLFALSGEFVPIGLFTPVNESVWEHLKLLFFPYFFYSIAEFFLLQKPAGFFMVKFKGAVVGMVFIVAFFYTYSGILGKSILVFDILSFFLGVFAAFLTSYMLIKNGAGKKPKANAVGLALFAVTAGAFFLFTFCPPFLEIFKDPRTLGYGI